MWDILIVNVGLQGSMSDSRVTKSKNSNTKENTSAPVTPSLRTLLPYSRGSNENMNCMFPLYGT